MSASPKLYRALALPPRLAAYDDFTKNAGQVAQIENALRSLTYVIPGHVRDAEIATESIHSGVQLLSLYHDSLIARAVARLPDQPSRSAHARYTRFWMQQNPLYRRIALILQTVVHTQLLCEMAAKRRGGDKSRWRSIVLLECVKAVCRLLLLRITRSRPLLNPVVPEREAIPSSDSEDCDAYRSESELMDEAAPNATHSSTSSGSMCGKSVHEGAWKMPRTGLSFPPLPESGDLNTYLLNRVLTAEDIKPAIKLLNELRGSYQVAEILHILAPLVYALALARSRDKMSWTPWVTGLAVECAARQLRDRSLRATALERLEWNGRAWAMGWWAMRGAFYDKVTKSLVVGVGNKLPGFLAAIFEDYQYLWENYYFSTSG